MCRFNPRPGEGGDTPAVRMIVKSSLFQSTPPRGGDRRFRIGYGALQCFNPRPREGATTNAQPCQQSYCVSIHAPARGRPIFPVVPMTRIPFQSTPPRGGDHCPVPHQEQHHGFNPRPREGATGQRRAMMGQFEVSIHAPARGRRFPPRLRRTHTCFNPRPREGATGRAERFAQR